ncbi:MAG: phosphatase PAP2 family protein [Dehalococcoidia bacterium]
MPIVPAAGFLPFEFDVLLIGRWPLIIVGMIILIRLLQPRSKVTLPEVAREAVFVVGAFLLYSLVRNNVDGREVEAVQRALRLIDMEQALGIFREPEMQREVLASPRLMNVANGIYVWAHFPVIIFTGIWLFTIHRDDYPVYRNAFLISGAIGLAVYATLPVAPPRFVEGFGFVDTLAFRESAQQMSLPGAWVNEYAAVPSLHLGWNFLAGIAIYRHMPYAPLKPLGLLMPAAMFFSIVATGNHFIIDGLAGMAVAALALMVALAIRSLVHEGYAQGNRRLAAWSSFV